MKPPRVAAILVRPDMRWIEDLLGQSVQCAPPLPLRVGVANPALNAAAIPWGEYCYDPRFRGVHVPCRYFRPTRSGTVRCTYLGVDSSGSTGCTDLEDSLKICSVNREFATLVGDLEAALINYEGAVGGFRRDEGLSLSSEFAYWPDLKLRLLTAAYDRLNVWEILCGMAQAVPLATIERIVRADALLRSHTDLSDTTICRNVVENLPDHGDPQRQYWYFYRQNFRPAQGT